MAAVYSFSAFLLSTCSGPDPVLGAGDSSMNKIDKKIHSVWRFHLTFATWHKLSRISQAPFHLLAWPTLEGEGVISSIVLLRAVRRSRIKRITRGPLVHKGWRWDWDPGICFLAIVTCPALLTGPRLPTSLPLLRLFPMPFLTVPSVPLLCSH